MLKGTFVNCYGLKEFDMPEIDFSSCNKAIIYAPNGVMKSSLAKVFEDLSKGKATTDRIFKDVTTCYSITHYAKSYIYSSATPGISPEPIDKIYVINSFSETFNFTKETVSTLLADETTRIMYDEVIEKFSGETRQIEEKLRVLTGLTKSKIKGQIIVDFDLSENSDWTDIIEELIEQMPSYEKYDFLDDVKYNEMFNDKALDVYQNPEFRRSIKAYITNLNEFLKNNPILCEKFTDRSAEALGKEFTKNNLFEAQHTIMLRDGKTIIHSAEEWDTVVASQLKELYAKPELSKEFKFLKGLLTANTDVNKVRDILIAHREIIPLLFDITKLKKQVWLHCMKRLDKPFGEYSEKIMEFTSQIRALYEKASEQSQRWQEVVSEFNRRFRVPFEMKIDNKANFLLKDEAPRLSFIYSRGTETTKQTENINKDDLMRSLSLGEKRALYLLYILFDLERIRRADEVEDKFLIIVDDVADSFDYKNKYAIIEYLNDLSKNKVIDLLILTHNYDFFRTVYSRLCLRYLNCYIAQKNPDGIISMKVFKYQHDFFKKIVIDKIKDGQIDSDDKIKILVASIPFYRNLCNYNGKECDYNKLTCFLHLKTAPLNTTVAKLSDLWLVIRPYLNEIEMSGTNEDYYGVLQRIATNIVKNPTDEVYLENKLVVAIATRLLAESFMKRALEKNGQTCAESEYNQTRNWFKMAREYLTSEQINIIEEVNLITPENIHLNSFMYEPLIDISDWTLKELYNSVSKL